MSAEFGPTLPQDATLDPTPSSPTDQEKKRLALRYLCSKSFYHFVKVVGGSVEQGGVITPEIHGRLSLFFQDKTIKRKCIFMPRNWLKSTVYTQWGAIWLYLQDHEVRILIASQNEDIAARFLYFIQHQILNNKILRWLYPELLIVNDVWRRQNRWSSDQIDLPRSGGYKEATITSVGVTSASQSGHYTHLFIDDPVGQKHIDSPIEMERVFRWMDNTKELLVNPNYMNEDGSFIFIICTFWGVGDFGTYVQDKYKEYHWYIVPGLKDNSKINDDTITYVQNTNAGQDESNWESAPGGRSSTEYYHSMRANPEQEMIFWAQIMNDPHRATLLTKFDYSWIRWFRFDDRPEGRFIVCEDDKEEFFVSDIPLYGMIDPGGFAEMKMMKKGSRNAVLIGGQPRETVKKFVFYTWAGRLKEPEAFLDEIFKAHMLWHPRLWEIETIAAQKYIYKDIVESRRRRGVALPISELPPDVSKGIKDADIQALLNPMQNGEIFLHRSMKELIAEIKSYPHGLTVDLLDMLGKLYRYHWSRRPLAAIRKSVAMDWSVDDGRSEITGY